VISSPSHRPCYHDSRHGHLQSACRRHAVRPRAYPSLSVLRRSGSMNNGLHAGSGVSCHVKPSRRTWPRPSCALTWTCCVISRSTTSSSCTVTRSLDYSTSTARSSKSTADARRPRRGSMLTAVTLDNAQELLKDVFDVDDVMRTDVTGH